MTFAREAWLWAAPAVAAALVLASLGHRGWAALAAALAAALVLFFRIPERAGDAPPGVVLAPANGVVTAIDRVHEPEVTDGPLTRVAVFLSVFDVHVQRAPVSGRVIRSRFKRGRKVAAFRSDADRVNESHLTVLETPGGEIYAVRQIAGLVARRVVSYLEVGEEVRRGDLIGLIRFGSRVDLYLPEGIDPCVAVGDRVIEGLTPMAGVAEGDG